MITVPVELLSEDLRQVYDTFQAAGLNPVVGRVDFDDGRKLSVVVPEGHYPLSLEGDFMVPVDFFWALLPEQRRRSSLMLAGAPLEFLDAMQTWAWSQFRPDSLPKLYEQVKLEMRMMREFDELGYKRKG